MVQGQEAEPSELRVGHRYLRDPQRKLAILSWRLPRPVGGGAGRREVMNHEEGAGQEDVGVTQWLCVLRLLCREWNRAQRQGA